ncbi:class I SAM-dependent methyltransferase [Cytobacillus purgationiresistens]|uniref:SAM-dependent MidA family methyltransferase n=1 Tax=Cytobacillus purgationiresistens TaxID=863449 RepID=A0ABU0ADV7_9BACI|nr:SAM-dependent methyltransferase [Cytobacillus purgationiresistens]MDQ0269431.1 SAM-dependent MidA family methyltransferase [Cytobacillus purgationiresistens]
MLKFLQEYINVNKEKMIDFADFMSQALYHPIYGYYMRSDEKIGAKGDFITSSNIADIYGRIVAKWYQREAEEHNLPASVCEIGAGNGRFAKAFIEEWNAISNKTLYYYLIDESKDHRKLQSQLLPQTEHIQQMNQLEELSSFSGLIFSNELFDAFPVHVIERVDGELVEVMVAFDNGKLIEKKMPVKNVRMINFLKQSSIHLVDGQRIEIPLEMEPMLIRMAGVLERGFILTVDYGYSDQEWQEPARKNGSLRGYRKHQMISDVLQYPGEMDLTSHVHFDSLIRIGETAGLSFVKKWRQDEFLLDAGILEELTNHADIDPFSEASKRNRAIRSLLMTSGISQTFHVILQQKQ